jgi:predicted polyphosphate/ATP-dependent NAD kinase
MHSAVFAPGPSAAGDVAAAFFTGHCNHSDLVDAEVMDREDADASPRLYGTLRVPASSHWAPHPKAGSAGNAMLEGACERVARQCHNDDCLTFIGPGATMRRIKERLGFRGTLLGVDACRRGRLVRADVGERQILDLLDGPEGRIVVSIVGGQGFLFGRGNQQFSPAVIRRVGRERIVVVASTEKLVALAGRPLLVDSGDASLDRDLAGFITVHTGARRSTRYRVTATGIVAEGPRNGPERRT